MNTVSEKNNYNKFNIQYYSNTPYILNTEMSHTSK